MSMRTDAVYAGGELKLLEPLDLEDNQHVVMGVTRVAQPEDDPDSDWEFLAELRREMKGSPQRQALKRRP